MFFSVLDLVVRYCDHSHRVYFRPSKKTDGYVYDLYTVEDDFTVNDKDMPFDFPLYVFHIMF